jgi:hypothetical protein
MTFLITSNFSDFFRRVKTNRVAVVGIFGKTRFSSSRLEKGFLFDDLNQKDVFRIADDDEDGADGDMNVILKCYI